MTDSGFIWLWRKMMDEPWYVIPNTCHLAVHLIFRASIKKTITPTIYGSVELERGQILTGRKALAKETGLSVQEVRTALRNLKNTKFVTIESTKQYSIITICKYAYWQDKRMKLEQDANQGSNHQPTISQPSANHQLTTYKEDKGSIRKKKEEKEGGVPPPENPPAEQEQNHLLKPNYQTEEKATKKDLVRILKSRKIVNQYDLIDVWTQLMAKLNLSTGDQYIYEIAAKKIIEKINLNLPEDSDKMIKLIGSYLGDRLIDKRDKTRIIFKGGAKRNKSSGWISRFEDWLEANGHLVEKQKNEKGGWI